MQSSTHCATAASCQLPEFLTILNARQNNNDPHKNSQEGKAEPKPYT